MAARLDIQVRRLQGAQVDTALAWAAEKENTCDQRIVDGWKAVDASGLLLGLVDGEPAGAVAALRYSRTFGFIGLHVVRQGFRDAGVGQALWRAAMKHLNGCCVGFDARGDQRGECAHYGFSMAYRCVRYQAAAAGDGRAASRVANLKGLGLTAVQRYDQTVFPAERGKLLRWWMGKSSAALGIDVDGRCLGYGVVRECQSGCFLGPVYAVSPELAEDLLVALRAWPARGKAVYLDAPEANPPAVAVARRLGMRKVGESTRMYAGGLPATATDEWYGISSGLG